MFEFKRTRELFKFLKNPKRYSSRDGEEVNLEESADPSTWRDTTTPTLAQRLSSRRRQLSAFAFLGFVAFAMIGVYSQRFFPGLYQNIWLQRGLVIAIGVPAIFIGGVRWWRGQLEKIEWLVLIGPKSGIEFYLGKFDPHGDASFQPLKGFVWAGLRGRKLQLRDLDDDMARQWAKRGRDPDDPAEIRVEDARYHAKDTFMGTIVGVVTSGLEIDTKARNSDVYCAPPDMADRETYLEMTRKLEQTQGKVEDLEDEKAHLEEERDDWKNEAMKKREEIESGVVELIGDVGEAVDLKGDGRRRRRTSKPQENGQADYPLDGDDQ